MKRVFVYGLCICTFLVFALPGKTSGQKNGELADFALRAGSGSEISFVFSATDHKGKEIYKDSGKSVIYGNKYRMEIPGELLVVNNGVTRWIYKPGEEEIVIAPNNPGEEDVMENPFAVLRAGNNGKIKNYTVAVTPRGAGGAKGLQGVPDRIILTATGGARYTIQITGFKPLPDIPGEWFELDTKKYPEAVVTDLR